MDNAQIPRNSALLIWAIFPQQIATIINRPPLLVSDSMDLFLILQFGIIGALLSEVDVMVDEHRRGGEFASILLAIVCAFMMARLIAIDQGSAIIFTGILVAVIAGAKVDALPFILGFLIAAGGALYRIIYGNFLLFLPISLALGFSGFVDEYGHGRIPKIRDGLMQWFFEHRFTMKLAVFALAYVGAVSFSHFAAFLAFDVAYDLNSRR